MRGTEFGLALTASDARRIAAAGKRVVFISMDNAQPLAADPALLATYQRQGLRMLELSQTLIILSHSSNRAINPHPCKIDDQRLLRLAARGGVIQVNTYSSYLSAHKADPRRDSALRPLYTRLRQMAAQIAEAERQYPKPQASLDDFMQHLLHVLELVGPAHVGIGAVWDGGGLVDLKDVAQLPRITERLLQAGYSEQNTAAIWGENLLRVLDQAQAFASHVDNSCAAPGQGFSCVPGLFSADGYIPAMALAKVKASMSESDDGGCRFAWRTARIDRRVRPVDSRDPQ